MGSHLILVFLRAEFSRDRNDSLRWKFCSSNAVREEEKLREGAFMRALQRVGEGNGVRVWTRARWREQE
jgi:hypothetical protein